MKTKTITLLTKKIDSLVGAMNDFIPAHAHERVVDDYHRVTNIFGELMYETVYYWIVNRELRYDREALKRALTPFQWEMFTSIELKYLRIILHSEKTFTNKMNKEIAMHNLILN
jgi:hypothetical protein